MSRRQRKSKGSSSTHRRSGDSAVANAKTAERTASPAWNWWLLTLIAVTTLTVAGGYFWFTSETPTHNHVKRSSPVDVYRTAIVTNPKNHDAHYNLGFVLQSQGKLDEAISHYRQAVALSDGQARYHNNLGVALAVQDNLDEAIDHFNLAIKCDPDNAEAIFNLGNALFSQEKLADAITQYRRTLELKPDYAKAHNNLAVALKKTGHLEQAYQHRYEAMITT